METNSILYKSVIVKEAFDLLKKVEHSYEAEKHLSDETLESLHSNFGKPFIEASELLEKCKVTRYVASVSGRKIYAIWTKDDRYAIFENVNFCRCIDFKQNVLQSMNTLSCKHVLAVYLARITGNYIEEKLSNKIFKHYLDEQLSCLEEENFLL